MSEKALVPVEQKQVMFYDDELIAVRAADGQIYVSLPSMCEALGIRISGQTKRIKRHDVLLGGYQVLPITYTSKMDVQPTQRRQAGVLRVDLVPLWLTGLSVKSIRPEMRPKIKRYQQEAAKVLWEAFQEGRLTADPTFDELLQSDSDAVQAYKIAAAVMKLARTQILIESRLDTHEERLERIEAQLGDPGRHVSEEQASQISQAVKAVAMKLSERSGRNEYGGVYGELYRRFGITSYKHLPVARFDEALTWLSEWHASLAGDSPF